MHFVYDVDFVLSAGGAKLHPFDNLAGIFDAGVRGGIHFDNIYRTARGYYLTRFAYAAWPLGGRCGAVDGLGEQASHTGFADPTRAGEEVGMGNALFSNGVLQRLYHMFLPNQLPECL